MRTNNRKKALRRVNKVARDVNTCILNDDLWNGRFYMRQKEARIYPYEDGSGLDGRICYTFMDLKTGYSKDYWFNLRRFTHMLSGKTFWTMNDFIVNECKVWDENPRPYEQEKIIYRTDNSAPSY